MKRSNEEENPLPSDSSLPPAFNEEQDNEPLLPAFSDIAISSAQRDVDVDEDVDDLEPFEADLLDLIDDALPDDDEGEDGEDLFASDMERDYQDNDIRDQYEDKDMDDQDYESLDLDQRKIIEAKLRRRDRENLRRQGKLPAAFMDDEEEEDMRLLDGERALERRHRRKHDFDADDENALLDDIIPDLPDDELLKAKGTLGEWVANAGPRNLVKKKFRYFLTMFQDEDQEAIYGRKISTLGEENLESLEINYEHLVSYSAILAYYVTNAPAEVIAIFEEVAYELILEAFESYDNIHSEIHIRFTDLPAVENLRNLRQAHLNTLIRTSGVVTKRTGVFPQLKYVKYNCVKCGALLGPYAQESSKEMKIGHCPSCSSKGPFDVNSEETVYRNYQKITLQESPGSVPAGRLPRHREVIMLWDLVDKARPGEEIEITGIYRNNYDKAVNSKNGFPVFTTIIEANNIFKKEDMFASKLLNEDEIKAIRNLAKQPNIVNRIVKSIAPSIYGHEDIKRAIALSMFGGVPKNPQGKHRIRGDINILLLGDPGTAKSQFLKYTEKTAHRAVYATGQGASAVGLTAAVHKDTLTGEWTLEGGALVMADKGVCLIDEFDKMNDQDRTSIHEAMEQQSISISKAGIVTTLQARCAVIAAANPIRGRYNPQIPLSANVELTEPIISRFDILCVVRDTANPIADEHLARFVCNSHMKSHPYFDENLMDDDEVNQPSVVDPDIIPQELLKKYIMYAKERVHPNIAEADEDKLATFYSDLRRESLSSGAIPITVRYLESMIRMAEAFAKMQLRDYVRQDDIDRAISVMVKSFVSTQKISAQRSLERYLRKYMSFSEDSEELLNHILSEIMSEECKIYYYKNNRLPEKVTIDSDLFENRAADNGIHDVKYFYTSSLFTTTFQLDRANKSITKIFSNVERRRAADR